MYDDLKDDLGSTLAVVSTISRGHPKQRYHRTAQAAQGHKAALLKAPRSGLHRAVPAPQAVLGERSDQLEHSSVSEECLGPPV